MHNARAVWSGIAGISDPTLHPDHNLHTCAGIIPSTESTQLQSILTYTDFSPITEATGFIRSVYQAQLVCWMSCILICINISP